MSTTRPFSNQTSRLADQASQSIDSAMGSVQRMNEEAMSSLSELRDETLPVMNRVAAKAEELARRSADAMRDRGQHFREQAYRAQDMTVGYIKDEPMKSILIAAAAGAALMALVQLMRGRH